jgi:hypothetical protein
MGTIVAAIIFGQMVGFGGGAPWYSELFTATLQRRFVWFPDWRGNFGATEAGEHTPARCTGGPADVSNDSPGSRPAPAQIGDPPMRAIVNGHIIAESDDIEVGPGYKYFPAYRFCKSTER